MDCFMDKKQEKTKQQFQPALANPGGYKVAVIYSVKVCSVCLRPDARREEKQPREK